MPLRVDNKDMKHFMRAIDRTSKDLHDEMQAAGDRLTVWCWMHHSHLGDKFYRLPRFVIRHPVRAFRVWRSIRKGKS